MDAKSDGVAILKNNNSNNRMSSGKYRMSSSNNRTSNMNNLEIPTRSKISST